MARLADLFEFFYKTHIPVWSGYAFSIYIFFICPLCQSVRK
jgi:hypothetical protein